MRNSAARGVAKFTPIEALPKLVAALQPGLNQPVEERTDLIIALASYGSRAKPHLGVLEGILASEPDAMERQFIQGAIEKVRNSE